MKETGIELLENELSREKIFDHLDSALNNRKGLLGSDTTAYRLVNSTGDSLPGLFIDIYGKYAVCQFERKPISLFKNDILDWLKTSIGVSGIYEKSSTPRAREMGLAYTGNLWGEMPGLYPCIERGVKLLVDPTMSKTGYFLDFRECRRFIEERCAGLSVLDCFSFTCSIGLFAHRGGARSVVHVDKRQEVLSLGQRLYAENGLNADTSCFVKSDAIDYLTHMAKSGMKYDMVIIDPPEIAISAQTTLDVAGYYYNLNRLAFSLASPQGGIIISSCCSHGFPGDQFANIVENVSMEHGLSNKIIWSSGPPSDHPLSDIDQSLDYLRIVSVRR